MDRQRAGHGHQPHSRTNRHNIGNSIGGSMGGSIGRAIVRGALGGILRQRIGEPHAIGGRAQMLDLRRPHEGCGK
jgi:hypothetical protein